MAVTPAGAISFRYNYSINGRQETITFGRYGTGGITLSEAVTNARELYGLHEGETVAEAIARSYDAMKSDPSRAVTVDQVRQRLASEHAKKSN